MIVVDYYGSHPREVLQCLKASGVGGIARYLTNSPTDARQLTPQEYADAKAEGLAVYFVYEMNPTYTGYFTFAQGAEDCRQAQARLKELGAPDAAVVYFTVDVNIDPDLVVEYFNGIDSAATPAITPGVYGYQRMCEFAFEHFPNMGKHLWQTYGAPTVPLDLWQHLQETRCGVEVDVNEAKEEQQMTADEIYNLIAPLLQQKIVAPLTDTDNAIKGVLAGMAHHDHAWMQEQQVTLRVGGKTSQPLVPPVPGAAYFSSDDSLSMIGWTYPDGTEHFFLNGVEVNK